jgi:hypothetical protein
MTIIKCLLLGFYKKTTAFAIIIIIVKSAC